MVIKSVICYLFRLDEKEKSFTLTAQSLLQNRFQLQLWFHFLEDHGELMYKTQYEIDWGMEKDNVL